MTRRRRNMCSAVSVFVWFMITQSSSRTQGEIIIYSDDFSGSGSTVLAGLAPDIRPGSETWIASSNSPTWLANGAITGGGLARNAWLPFVPQSGEVYRLSLSIDVTNNTLGNWMALGFSPSNTTEQAFGANANAAPWVFKRGPNGGTAYQVVSGLGPGNSGFGTLGSGFSGSTQILIELDTRQPNWTAEWFVDGNSLRGPVAYDTNPTINYVGFGRDGDAVGSVSSFQLVMVPEPSMLVLAAVGLGFLSVQMLVRTRVVPAIRDRSRLSG